MVALMIPLPDPGGCARSLGCRRYVSCGMKPLASSGVSRRTRDVRTTSSAVSACSTVAKSASARTPLRTRPARRHPTLETGVETLVATVGDG
jgi:hypothetical protein